MKDLKFLDLGFAKVDLQRRERTGFPEVVYCAGKTPQQTRALLLTLIKSDTPILATRADENTYETVLKAIPGAVYHTAARIISIGDAPKPASDKVIAIVSAGTSDMPVCEEAAVTAEFMGNVVDRIYDVGVAGIHRLLAQAERIRAANVVIVAAGMEGALASVVGGLVYRPVIAVPTSVGYGANFGGLSALLAMLNSCAAGVTVVNIDNGFGAAYAAALINK